MISLLKILFINNWPRKLLSLILAIILWYVIHQSLTTTKTVANLPVRVVNIPPGSTVDGIQSNNVLTQRVSLTLSGHKSIIDDLDPTNLEVVVDATNKRNGWIENITKKNLHTLNPDVSVQQHVTDISQRSINIRLTKLVTEKIPIVITRPIGEAPKGYQFLDIWPYKLFITVSGPEKAVMKLKSRGVRLTFNLSDVSRTDLDDSINDSSDSPKDVVSFYIPNDWKQITIPELSSRSIEINDPSAKHLRIDFARNELIPLKYPIPLSLYFPPSSAAQLNPQRVSISSAGNIATSKYGMKLITKPLYVKGVSELFCEIMRDMLEIQILVKNSRSPHLDWSLQCMNNRALEDKFVSVLLSSSSNEAGSKEIRPQQREEYLRNRFRNFMNRMELFTADNKPLKLQALRQGYAVVINELKE